MSLLDANSLDFEARRSQNTSAFALLHEDYEVTRFRGEVVRPRVEIGVAGE